MAGNVNLDALIKREDMASGEFKTTKALKDINHTELELSKNTYSVLRKPDFQRETAMWTPEKVRDLILAYAEEDLVPAIILWRSPFNDLFVIDGAHRLSSLIAWVNDDYGDGIISQALFGEISTVQKETAQKARELINSAVGPYKVISEAFKSPNTPPLYVERAKRLVNCFVPIQQLETPDVAKAERSFFKINEQGVPLTATEIVLLHSRNCPNAIAARAVNQRGTGHPHWKKFAESKRHEIEASAQWLYDCFFTPSLAGGTIKSAEVPIGGRYSQSAGLGLLLNAVNIANKVKDDVPRSREQAEALVTPDPDGSLTLMYLQRTKRIMTRILNRPDSDFMGSLDLHPLVYVYSEGGRHQPSVFLAVLELVTQFEDQNSFKQFARVRATFEGFLIEHKDFLQQIIRKARGELRAVHKLKEYFDYVVTACANSTSDADIVKILQSSSEFKYLTLPTDEQAEVADDFSVYTKSKAFIKQELAKATICTICGARIPNQGLSFDHTLDKKAGGKGHESNIGLTHHYCNGAKDILLPMFKASTA
jgi:hypothetical protein